MQVWSLKYTPSRNTCNYDNSVHAFMILLIFIYHWIWHRFWLLLYPG